MAGILASGLAVSSARLEAKGKKGGGDITAVCNALLSVIENTGLPQAIRDAAQLGYDLLGCS